MNGEDLSFAYREDWAYTLVRPPSHNLCTFSEPQLPHLHGELVITLLLY